MPNTDSARLQGPALDRIECVLVFANGDSHHARIIRDEFHQWGGGTLEQVRTAAPILAALSHTFAAVTGGAPDAQS